MRSGWPFRHPINTQFRLNQDSPQARGLVFWQPLVTVVPGDRVGRVAMTPTAAPPLVAVGGRWAYSFNGSTQYLVSAAGTAPVTAVPLSLSCWFNATSDSAAQSLLSIGGSAAAADSFDIRLRGNIALDPLGAFTRDSVDFSVANTTTGYTINTWMLATGVYRLATARAAFINGGSKGTESTSRIPAGLNRIGIGALVTSTPTTFFAGYVADCRIYNRALSDAEVQELYQPDTRWELYEPLRKIWVVSYAPTPVVGTITITTPVQYKTYQRNGSNQADIAITGTYTGTPAAIEARFNGGAWATIDAAPAGGNYSGTLSNQAAGQGAVEVRFTDSITITASRSDIGIGDVYVVAGQSNAEGRATNARSFSHATLKATNFRQDDAWKNGNDPTDTGTSSGSPWPLLATLLMADQSVPVAFITTATGDTKLYTGTWTKNGAEYADCLQTIQNSGVNGVTAVLWHQGESDANDGVTQSQYQTALSNFLNDLQADTGFSSMKLVCAQLGHKTTGGVTRANLDAIRLAQSNRWDNDADILAGPVLYDIDLGDAGGDGVHFKTDAELQSLANRWWRMLEYHFYSGSEGRAPKFSAATYTGALITVTFTGGAGVLAGQTDITGWRVVDNAGVRTVNSAAASGANGVILTIDQALAAPVIVSFGSFNDAAASTLKDSGAYPLPPEPFVDQAVSLVAAGRSFFASPMWGRF